MTDDVAATIEGILGYAFQDRTLLLRAVTHSSAGPPHNEPLACLGDRIYNVWVARRIFKAQPEARKGTLTWQINQHCDGSAQARLVRTLELETFLILGGSIRGAGSWITSSMCATLLEAVVAAIELDGGAEAAVDYLDRAGGILGVPIAS